MASEIVLVEWEDSMIMRAGWYAPEVYQQFASEDFPVRHKAVGFLLARNESVVTLAQSLALYDRDDAAEAGNLIRIPVSCIRELKWLSE